MKPRDACYYIENKSYFIAPPANGFDPDEVLETPCWCLRTHEATGPDGDAVGPECCAPPRACYRPEVDIES